MKKVATWALVIAFIILVIDWCVIGLKLLDGNYDFAVETYIALACVVVVVVCAVYKQFSNKCPHCERLMQSSGKYCPHCGKEI